jgi:hypothetical protein
MHAFDRLRDRGKKVALKRSPREEENICYLSFLEEPFP